MECALCCVQGQGQIKGSKYHWLFTRMISSERFNLLWPNVIWKFIIMSQCHVQMFCYLQGQGYSVGSYYRFYYVSSTGDPFATKLSWMGHHPKPDCLVKISWIASFKVKFIMTVNKSLNICQSYIFCTTDLCNQNRCADILLLITRPSANWIVM